MSSVDNALVPWEHCTFESGTQVVLRSDKRDFGSYYHIGHLAHDNDGQGGRTDVAQELRDWLNGEQEPWWMEFLQQKSPYAVITPHGCEISAVGPMVDAAVPPAWGNWVSDPSVEADDSRRKLIHSLVYRVRPA